jgi:hypothetical protein
MKPTSFEDYAQDGPNVDNTLLLQFLIDRFDESLERANPRFPLLFQGLALSSVAHDEEAESEVRGILLPEGQLRRCRAILAQALERDPEAELSDQKRDKQDEEYPPLDEPTCRQFLLSAIREANAMINAADYRYASILKMLGWISLQHYPRRLKEFQIVWESCDEYPDEAIQRAVEVLSKAVRRKNRV